MKYSSFRHWLGYQQSHSGFLGDLARAAYGDIDWHGNTALSLRLYLMDIDATEDCHVVLDEAIDEFQRNILFI